MLVKICGITDEQTAKQAVNEGADFIGFVFAPSSRRIAPVDAKTIIKQIPAHVKKVGVFVEETIENMHFIAEFTGLDYIQLHGNEPAHVASRLRYPIIKAFTLTETDERTMATYPCDYLLIDSPGEKYRGGSGKTFDWSLFEQFNIDREKIILAGGLSAQNVQEAIRTVRPIAVDVSSGVETGGKKDSEKIRSFIKRAKSASSARHHVV